MLYRVNHHIKQLTILPLQPQNIQQCFSRCDSNDREPTLVKHWVDVSCLLRVDNLIVHNLWWHLLDI